MRRGNRDRTRARGRRAILVAERIIAAARQAGADAIHPGYGFLAENAGFAGACGKAGIVFVGPPPAAIEAMGLKDPRQGVDAEGGCSSRAGLSRREPGEAEFLKRKAWHETGYPVLIKAVAGGGGKGMRRVDKHSEFESALAGATREASAAFGDPRVLIEKYGRRAAPLVEIQVFADQHGNVIHLNERDCSLQRRFQKVIEESPAPGHDRGAARRDGRRRRRGRARGRLHRAPVRSSSSPTARGVCARTAFAVHGDEHAAAGRGIP